VISEFGGFHFSVSSNTRASGGYNQQAGAFTVILICRPGLLEDIVTFQLAPPSSPHQQLRQKRQLGFLIESLLKHRFNIRCEAAFRPSRRSVGASAR
jgi:hypothetical protein